MLNFSTISYYLVACIVIIVFLMGCSASQPPKMSSGHIHVEKGASKQDIPKPVTHTAFLPEPTLPHKQEFYTIVVDDVPVKELLFALSRDVDINVDIHPGITGRVTLNAVKQTLIQILNRIAEQIPLRYLIENNTLVISPDMPFLRMYQVNYLNMTRKSKTMVSVATQVSTPGNSRGGSGSGGGGGGNISTTSVSSESTHDLWDSLADNLKSILISMASPKPLDKPTAPTIPVREPMVAMSPLQAIVSGATPPRPIPVKPKIKTPIVAENNDVIVNPLSGIISVRATQRQHKVIQAFLDKITASIQRQVLIEATIVEVELSDRYQSGVDWKTLAKKKSNAVVSSVSMLGGNLSVAPAFLLGIGRSTANFELSADLKMLESFGNVKVLSSPKIIALNNQTSLLKVVDEKVFFNVTVKIEKDLETNDQIETFTTNINTVPVGMIMSVTPQINENGIVTMNVRPTITRITGFVSDPTPRLQGASFENLIPEIQVREMESLLQVRNGQTVVLGGLMQNKQKKSNAGIPYFSQLPFIGNLFKYRDDEFVKTELIIFLRPIVITNGDSNTELQAYKKYLPIGALDISPIDPHNMNKWVGVDR